MLASTHTELNKRNEKFNIKFLNMKWIRVTDRLPEINGGDFFVYYEDEKEFGFARFSEREMDESHWHDSGFSVYPSHWCLPVPPRVGV